MAAASSNDELAQRPTGNASAQAKLICLGRAAGFSKQSSYKR
jgi:hypothetical protein